MQKHCIALFAALLLTGTAAAQQPEARIAGLEQNEEYMSLLREDARLQQREDSISAAVVRLRGQLRDDPDHRQEYSQQIMRSENLIFDVRTEKGRVIDRINAIEQEWVLANLSAGPSRRMNTTDPTRLPDSLKVRNLVYNRPFRHYLGAQDHAALLQAQQNELAAIGCVNRYLAGYAEMAAMERAYDTIRTEAAAIELKARFAEAAAQNRRVADTLARTWNAIFDNKSYAYDYLLEALRKEKLLDRQAARLSEVMREVSALQGRTASDEIVDYFLRKQMLVDYELSVAEAFGLTTAGDSLQTVKEQLATIDYRLPKLTVADRVYIQYDSLVFSTRPKYTAQNPIPECRIYAQGTIYRVLLGIFRTKQPVSIFRNTSPVSWLQTDDGRWAYYAGGFATAAEAWSAQARLKQRGFTRPEVVVWSDGEYRNLSQDPPSATTSGYRVEVDSEAFTDPMRSALKGLYPAASVSRVGSGRFIAGPFATRGDADKAAEALRQAAGGNTEVKVVEITEP